MKTVIASVLVLALVSVAGAGYLAVRGIGAAAGHALAWLEPAVRSALPAELASAEIERRLDRALALVRDGRIDAAALRDTVLWLPGALIDGRLDAAEADVLARSLERVIAPPAPAET